MSRKNLILTNKIAEVNEENLKISEEMFRLNSNIMKEQFNMQEKQEGLQEKWQRIEVIVETNTGLRLEDGVTSLIDGVK